MEARAEDPTRAPATLPDAARDMDRDELSRLVRQINDSGVSYQKMADQASAAGKAISKPYFQKLATNGVAKTPDADMLEAIAAGIRQPLTVVQRAAAVQFLNYQATELSGYDDDVRVIVAHLAGMPESERRRWRRMIEAADTEG
jgi:hypothetical protein